MKNPRLYRMLIAMIGTSLLLVAVPSAQADWDIDINNSAQTNVTSGPNFTATGTPANLQIFNIRAALNAGNNVTINTGSGGTENGDISAGAFFDLGTSPASSPSTGGEVVTFDAAGNVDFVDLFLSAGASFAPNGRSVVFGPSTLNPIGGHVEILNDLSTRSVSGAAPGATSGNATFNVTGDIRLGTADVDTGQSSNVNGGPSGNVILNSLGGSVFVQEISTAARSVDGATAGFIDIDAAGDVFAGRGGTYLSTLGQPSASTSGSAPDGGNIDITAGGDVRMISTGSSDAIRSSSNLANISQVAGSAGNVTIFASGEIDLPTTDIFARTNGAGTTSSGGQVFLSGANGVAIDEVYTYSQAISGSAGFGGIVQLLSNAGDISATRIDTWATNRFGGNVTVGQAFLTQNVSVKGIHTGADPDFAIGDSTNAGSVTLAAIDNIDFENIVAEGLNVGGTVSISTNNGDVTGSDPTYSLGTSYAGIYTRSINNNSGSSGGGVTIDAGGSIDLVYNSDDYAIDASSPFIAGSVSLTAGQEIRVTGINADGAAAGNVTLRAEEVTLLPSAVSGENVLGDQITLRTDSAATPIELGGTSGTNNTGAMNLDQAELDRVQASASRVYIGDNSGNASITTLADTTLHHNRVEFQQPVVTDFKIDMTGNGQARYNDGLAGSGAHEGGQARINFDFEPGGSGTVGNFDFLDSTARLLGKSTSTFDITSPTSYDSVFVDANGTLDINSAADLTVNMLGSFTPSAGDMFEIFDIAGTRTGLFSGLPDGAVVDTFGTIDLVIDYFGDDGNDIVLLAEEQAPPAGDLLVVKFHDLNEDGVFDAGIEPLLKDWTFNYTGPESGNLITDINGEAMVSLTPGTYSVTEVLQAGWFSTTGGLTQQAVITDGNQTRIEFGNAVIPEPASLALLAIGGTALLCGRRR